jgi:hypothetical protein
MGVAVEEPVPEDHRHPRLGHQVRDPPPVLERPFARVDVRHLDPAEVLERQHRRARVAPVHARHADVRVAGEVAVEGVGVAPLQPVVELLPDLARELVHQLPGVDEVERADAFPGQPGGLVEQREVGLDLARRVGTLHLDDDAAPVGQRRPVHLADRRRGDRTLLELQEELVERQLELALDRPLDVLERERTDVVLEGAQLGDDVRRDDVRPGREQLAELDERRSELVEHLPKADAARRRLALHELDPAAARQQVGEPVRLEEVAEAVADGDLRDLRESAEVAGGRGGHGPQCCTAGGAVLPPLSTTARSGQVRLRGGQGPCLALATARAWHGPRPARTPARQWCTVACSLLRRSGRAHGPGGTSSCSRWRYAKATRGTSASRSTQT